MDSSSKYLGDPDSEFLSVSSAYGTPSRDHSDALYIDEISTQRLKDELKAREEYPLTPKNQIPLSPSAFKQPTKGDGWITGTFILLFLLGILLVVVSSGMYLYTLGIVPFLLGIGCLMMLIGSMGTWK